MRVRDIPKARKLSNFSRVVLLNLHPQFLEIQGASANWKILERIMLKEYSLDDFSQITKKDLMD